MPKLDYDPDDGELYSQVDLIRQVRIVAGEVTREFYYVTATINPDTYDLIEANAQTLPQPVVTEFLQNARFVDPDAGYQWAIYGREIMGDENPEKMLRDATNRMLALHKIVLQLVDSK